MMIRPMRMVCVRHIPTGLVVRTDDTLPGARSSSFASMRARCLRIIRALVAAVHRGGWASPVGVVRTYEDPEQEGGLRAPDGLT